MNEFLEQLLKSNSTNQLAGELNLDSGKLQDIAKSVLPTLLEGLNQSTQTEEQAQNLDKALEKHNGNGLEDLLSNLQNVDLNDGAKIASHIFNGSSNYEQIFSDFAGKFGISQEQSKQVFDFLSPMVMQFLGQKKNETTEQTNLVDLTSELSKQFTGDENGIDLGQIFSMLTGK